MPRRANPTAPAAACIRAWRQRRRLTQREAAAALNVKLSRYQHWEHGIRQPPGDVVAGILTGRHG